MAALGGPCAGGTFGVDGGRPGADGGSGRCGRGIPGGVGGYGVQPGLPGQGHHGPCGAEAAGRRNPAGLRGYGDECGHPPGASLLRRPVPLAAVPLEPLSDRTAGDRAGGGVRSPGLLGGAGPRAGTGASRLDQPLSGDQGRGGGAGRPVGRPPGRPPSGMGGGT